MCLIKPLFIDVTIVVASDTVIGCIGFCQLQNNIAVEANTWPRVKLSMVPMWTGRFNVNVKIITL